jgi:signal transduction histidine kinase/DNA-binding response OmpR family regulator
MECEPQQINILLVDDKANNLLALESILAAPDRNLIRAQSGDEALRYLLDCDVAVILLDVHMPGIDGLETAALIRGRERSRNTPIIFLTADSNGGALASRGYLLGAVDYIQKPLDPETLRSKVAVFVELFKKTEEVKHQAELLREKNIELESANLRRLSMLVDLGQQLAAERDPERLLEIFCDAARSIVRAKYSAVGISDDGGTAVAHLFFSPPTMDGPLSDEVYFKGLIQEALPSKHKPVRLDHTVASSLPKNVYANGKKFRSLLAAPIVVSSRRYGWLFLADKRDQEQFSEADERLAVTLTSQVAVAYENARLYAEAQKHAAELQQEVAERIVAEQERAKLLVLEKEAREEAEAANRTKDEFLATLSHELRTPLTAILGWSHLLRSGKLPPDSVNDALETIERNAKSQSQLIDDLLDVSRIVTGKLRLETSSLEIAPVIDAAIRSVLPAAEAKRVSLTKSLVDSGCAVYGDSTRLQQIVWNLLSNAVKFTPSEGHVDVSLRRRDPIVELEISDTGQGISADFLPHVFDRFRQADGTTTRAHGGLGLGLAIVRHLVELHGGSIQVESQGEGKGSSFVVQFPLSEKEAMPVCSEIGGSNSWLRTDNGMRPVLLDSLKVLLVDDDRDTREMIATVLSGAGASVEACSSAAEALGMLSGFNPDVIISDIGMPDEDGYWFIQRLRNESGNPFADTPAIALTAYASSEDRKRTLAAGFQMHMPKPLEPRQLVSAVANLAGRDATV